MAEYIIQEETLVGIADAIRSKTGESGRVAVADMAEKISEIAVGGGGADAVYKVIVLDYDGSVLVEESHSEGDVYTIPDPPEHSRLTFDGWASSAEIVDNTVTFTDDDILIGATYLPVSGATEIDIELTTVTGLTFTFNSVLGGMTSIDWGDGTIDTSLSHTYAAVGEYTIKIYGMTYVAVGSASSGGLCAASSSAPNYTVRNIIWGESVSSVHDHACYYFFGLRSMMFPKNVTTIGSYCCSNCDNMLSVIISTNTQKNRCFSNCSALRYAVFAYGVTTIAHYIFQYCLRLAYAPIPKSVTSIGTYAFYQNRLQRFVCPAGLTTIGDYGVNVNYIYDFKFNNCGITTLAKGLLTCIMQKEIVIPDSVTTVNAYCVSNNPVVERIVFQASPTTIADKAMPSVRALKELDFSACASVPSLAAATAFTLPPTCKILVPASLYNAWISATYWSTFANYIEAV